MPSLNVCTRSKSYERVPVHSDTNLYSIPIEVPLLAILQFPQNAFGIRSKTKTTNVRFTMEKFVGECQSWSRNYNALENS